MAAGRASAECRISPALLGRRDVQTSREERLGFVGATAADVAHSREGNSLVASFQLVRIGLPLRFTVVGICPAKGRTLGAFCRHARFVDGATSFGTVRKAASGVNTRTACRRTLAVCAPSALADMPADAAVVRVSRRVRTSCSGSTGTRGSGAASGRCSAGTWRAALGGSCAVAGRASAVAAVTADSSRSAVGGTVSAQPRHSGVAYRVGVVAAIAGGDGNANSQHHQHQSSVRMHRQKFPFPTLRANAFHASAIGARSVEIAL